MARLFDDASSQYLTRASAVVTAEPLTMACWFLTDSLTQNQCMMSISYHDGGDNGDLFGLYLFGAVGGDPVVAYAFDNGASSYAETSIAYSTGTWQHACAVFIANNNRAVYLNGGNKGTDNVQELVNNLDTTSIGANHRSSMTFARYTSGYLAECGIWNAALTDAEVAVLAEGYSPLLVRPQSLVSYWPLIGRTSPEIDPVGGSDLTLVNGPTVGAHTRVLYSGMMSGSYGTTGPTPSPDVSIPFLFKSSRRQTDRRREAL